MRKIRPRLARILRILPLAAALAGAFPACRVVERSDLGGSRPRSPASALDAVAEGYVRLVLAVGVHDPDYVDAYYGPESWREEAKSAARPLADLHDEALRRIAELNVMKLQKEEAVGLRRSYLVHQLGSLARRCRILQGKKLSFDEESKALYDAVAPTRPESYYDGVLEQLDRVLPGRGPLLARLEAFKKEFVVPPERLDAVFSAAIQEARRRTRAHLVLPPEESFEVEYVTGKPWSAYNWYKKNFHSVIQVNTDLPIYVDAVVHLASHEGYPGHHVYNALLEWHLVRERGWIEFSVYPLFSPQSLIAEGSADYGVDIAFPGDEREAFERDVLYPLAGLDRRRAGVYHDVMEVMKGLDFAQNEAARRLVNGEIGEKEAAEWLTRYALMLPDRAAQRVRFIQKYRSYVINYNLGEELVKSYVERRGGTADRPERRWEIFGELISSPRLPSGLR